MEYDVDKTKQTQTSEFSWPSGAPSNELFQIEEPTITETTMDKTQHQPTNLFNDKEKYLAFRKQWSKLASEKKLTGTMMVFYNLARGKEYMRGFTPVTNQIKLANGMDKDLGLNNALDMLDYLCLPPHKQAEEMRSDFVKLFEGTIDDEFVTTVANYMGTAGV